MILPRYVSHISSTSNSVTYNIASCNDNSGLSGWTLIRKLDNSVVEEGPPRSPWPSTAADTGGDDYGNVTSS